MTLTRSYAVQRRYPVSLVVDPTNRRMYIREDGTTVLRTLDLGEASDLEVATLDSNLDGDSLTFDARGLCAKCGVTGKAITLDARGSTYDITFNALGRWKSNKRAAAEVVN